MPVLHVPSPLLHMVTKHTIGTHALDEGKGLLPSLSNILPCQLMKWIRFHFLYCGGPALRECCGRGLTGQRRFSHWVRKHALLFPKCSFPHLAPWIITLGSLLPATIGVEDVVDQGNKTLLYLKQVISAVPGSDYSVTGSSQTLKAESFRLMKKCQVWAMK